MRILFFGTPEFSRDLLDLLSRGQTIVGVVTQPDRPKGRGRRTQPSPVKEWALQRQMPVFTPSTLKDPRLLEELRALRADVCVVAAFGMLFPKDLLELAPRGALNIHTSLLPKYRGASPVESAILAGEALSGVTLMQMDEGLDSGPVYSAAELSIEEKNAPQILSEMVVPAARLLGELLSAWERGESPCPRPQRGIPSYCGKIEKSAYLLNWNESAVQLARCVRAYYPNAYTFRGGERLRILDASPASGSGLAPGTVSDLSTSGIKVASKTGDLLIECLQRSGKRALPAGEFLRGARLQIGEQLGGNHVSV